MRITRHRDHGSDEKSPSLDLKEKDFFTGLDVFGFVFRFFKL